MKHGDRVSIVEESRGGWRFFGNRTVKWDKTHQCFTVRVGGRTLEVEEVGILKVKVKKVLREE